METRKYNIRNVRLISTKKQIDISNIFVEINIFEDIFSPTISGNIAIQETDNLPSTFPILGGEYIVIEMEVPTIIDHETNEKRIFEINFVGRITRVQAQKMMNTGGLRYVISFTAPETIDNFKYRISKSFKNIPYSEIAEYAFSVMESKSKFVKEYSKNSDHVIIPGWTPIKTINWCAARAIQTSSPVSQSNSTFLFFQNLYYSDDQFQTGKPTFKFVSIDSLLSKNIKKYIYNFPITHRKTYDPLRYVVTETFEVVHSFDFLKNIHQGLYAGSYLEHDLITKSFRRNSFDYRKNFNEFAHTNQVPHISDDNELNEYRGVSVYHTSFENKQFYTKLLRLHQLLILDNYVLKMSIPGDAFLCAGDIVHFAMPNISKTDTTKFDPLYSGKYLITSICHSFSTEDYKMNIQCAKETLRGTQDNE